MITNVLPPFFMVHRVLYNAQKHCTTVSTGGGRCPLPCPCLWASMTSTEECYWHCSDEIAHYRSDERCIFAVLDIYNYVAYNRFLNFVLDKFRLDWSYFVPF